MFCLIFSSLFSLYLYSTVRTIKNIEISPLGLMFSVRVPSEKRA